MRSQNKRLHNRHLLSSNRKIRADANRTKEFGGLRGFDPGKHARDAAGNSDLCDDAQYLSRRFRRADRVGCCSSWSGIGIGVGCCARFVRRAADRRRSPASAPRSDRDRKRLQDSQGQFIISSLCPAVTRSRRWAALLAGAARKREGSRRAPWSKLTLNTLYEVIQWLPADRARATRRRTTGHGRCVPRRIGLLLRWLEEGRSSLCPMVRERGQIEGPPDGYRPGRDLWRERRAILHDGGRYANEAANCWPASILLPDRCRHGVDAGFPAGSRLCRLGAVGGRDIV